jgi:hypothetical protein
MRRRVTRSYTIPAAALELKVSEKTVRRWISAGQLSARWVSGRGGGRWLLTSQALTDARRRHAHRIARRWIARLSCGAYLAPDVADSARSVYSLPAAPADVPVHRATVYVTLAEWRHLIRRPRSTKAKMAIYADVLRRCGLSADAVVRLRVRFELDSEDLARVFHDVVWSVRPPTGLDDSLEDLQSEAVLYLLQHGLPALRRVRDKDPLPYLRRMTRNFYRDRGRARTRAAARALTALPALVDLQEKRDDPLTALIDLQGKRDDPLTD